MKCTITYWNNTEWIKNGFLFSKIFLIYYRSFRLSLLWRPAMSVNRKLKRVNIWSRVLAKNLMSTVLSPMEIVGAQLQWNRLWFTKLTNMSLGNLVNLIFTLFFIRNLTVCYRNIRKVVFSRHLFNHCWNLILLILSFIIQMEAYNE